jgi:hypothetical protein
MTTKEPQLPEYGRYIIAADGKSTLRYSAIDPSKTAFVCTCNNPNCSRARLLPFRSTSPNCTGRSWIAVAKSTFFEKR